LVRGQRLNDPILKNLATKHNKTEAQILLRWSLQMVCLSSRDSIWVITLPKGFSPLPKSTTLSRIEENANVYDFELTEECMKSLDTGKYEPCAWDPTVNRD